MKRLGGGCKVTVTAEVSDKVSEYTKSRERPLLLYVTLKVDRKENFASASSFFEEYNLMKDLTHEIFASEGRDVLEQFPGEG